MLPSYDINVVAKSHELFLSALLLPHPILSCQISPIVDLQHDSETTNAVVPIHQESQPMQKNEFKVENWRYRGLICLIVS